MLEAHIVLETADQQDERNQCIQDADNNDAGRGREPYAPTGESGICHCRAQPKEERGEAKVRDQPARECHPLQDPDHKTGHHYSEGHAAAKYTALENVIAPGTRQGC